MINTETYKQLVNLAEQLGFTDYVEICLIPDGVMFLNDEGFSTKRVFVLYEDLTLPPEEILNKQAKRDQETIDLFGTFFTK